MRTSKVFVKPRTEPAGCFVPPTIRSILRLPVPKLRKSVVLLGVRWHFDLRIKPRPAFTAKAHEVHAAEKPATLSVRLFLSTTLFLTAVRSGIGSATGLLLRSAWKTPRP